MSTFAPFSEYDMGHGIDSQLSLQGILVKYAITDGDSRSTQDHTICLHIYGYKSSYLHASFFISLFSICFVDIELSLIFSKNINKN